MFSLSPRHQGLLGLTDYANNTSSTDNSNSTSSSSHEIATHPASASHEEATPTEIGAISAALPVMMCGLSYNRILSHSQANELKNSADDGAEMQRVAFANFGTDNKALNFFSHTHTPSPLSRCHDSSFGWQNCFVRQLFVCGIVCCVFWPQKICYLFHLDGPSRSPPPI